ncbi:hypothetical protein [Methanoculleus methanifontis]|nr:hypothetical protein [Methanoculleus sp. FWC-SCC3]
MLHERGNDENTVSLVIGVMLMLDVTSGSRCGIATGRDRCILRRPQTLN